MQRVAEQALAVCAKALLKAGVYVERASAARYVVRDGAGLAVWAELYGRAHRSYAADLSEPSAKGDWRVGARVGPAHKSRQITKDNVGDVALTLVQMVLAERALRQRRQAAELWLTRQQGRVAELQVQLSYDASRGVYRFEAEGSPALIERLVDAAERERDNDRRQQG